MNSVLTQPIITPGVGDRRSGKSPFKMREEEKCLRDYFGTVSVREGEREEIAICARNGERERVTERDLTPRQMCHLP